MSDLISVIIPVYNRAEMIGRAVSSVLDQNYPDLEIIIVDDLSQDNPEAEVRKINDPRVRYVRRQKNGGAGAARNTGLELARGKYICFLDSDDEYCDCFFSALLDLHQILSPLPGLVFANCLERGESEKLSVPERILSGFVKTGKRFPASVFCPPSSWMVNRKLLAEEKFDERFRTKEDMDLFARLVRKAPAYFLNQPLTLKHVHSCKSGRVPLKYAEATGNLMLEKWESEMTKDKRFMIDFCSTMAKDLTRSGNKKKALSYLCRALFISPVNGRVWKGFFRLIFTSCPRC